MPAAFRSLYCFTAYCSETGDLSRILDILHRAAAAPSYVFSRTSRTQSTRVVVRTGRLSDQRAETILNRIRCIPTVQAATMNTYVEPQPRRRRTGITGADVREAVRMDVV